MYRGNECGDIRSLLLGNVSGGKPERFVLLSRLNYEIWSENLKINVPCFVW